MTAPLVEEPPPPPLLVPAARELSRFGWIWTVAGIALVVAALASGATAELDVGEMALLAALVVLSLGGVLGAVLLARRTGPEILYYRILDRAPPPPPGVPRETSGATTRRVAPPALALTLVLVWVGIIGGGAMLLFGGQPRDELTEDLPAAALIASGAWTLACGLTGLRMASYFVRWQRLRDAVALCRPLKAGTMRPVYWVDRGPSAF